MASLKFNNVYISDFKTLAGPLEKEGKISKCDFEMDDYYYGEKTFEKTEVKMQKLVINELLKKNGLNKSDISLLVGGDLLDQTTATNYAATNLNISHLGIYSACATFTESLIVSAMFLQNDAIDKVITVTSSHNLSAEKQYRYPIEYGSPRPKTQTFTTTAAVSSLLCKNNGKVRIDCATIGKVIDLGVSDAFNLGAVMAPAAASTIHEHLKDTNRDISYYDLILTGDLGCVGVDILKEYCKIAYNLKLKKHMDAGCEIYLKSHDVLVGGSGPTCLPLVLFNKVLKNKQYKKILIVGTGALHSKTFVNQKSPIPAISHAVSLEVL